MEMSRSSSSTSRSSDTSLDSLTEGFYFNNHIVNVKWKGSGSRRKLQVCYDNGTKEQVADLEDLSVYKVLRDGQDNTTRVNEKGSIATLSCWMLSNNVRISSGKTCWNRVGNVTGYAVKASLGVLYYCMQAKIVHGHATAGPAPGVRGIHLEPESRDDAGNITNRIILHAETLYNIAGPVDEALATTSCQELADRPHNLLTLDPAQVDGNRRIGMFALGQLRRIASHPQVALVTTSKEGNHVAGGMRGGVLTFAYSYTDGMIRPSVCADYLRYGDSRHCSGSTPNPPFCCRTKNEGGLLVNTTNLEVYDVSVTDNATLSRLNKTVRRAVQLLMKTTPLGASVDVPGKLAEYTLLEVRDVMLSLYSLGLLDSLMGGPNCGYSHDPDRGNFISTRIHTAAELRGTVFAETSTGDWVNLNTGAVGSMVCIAPSRYDMINMSGKSDSVSDSSYLGRMDLSFKVFQDSFKTGGVLSSNQGTTLFSLPQKCQEWLSVHTVVGQLFTEPQDAVTAVGIVLGNLEFGRRSYIMGALQDAGCGNQDTERRNMYNLSLAQDDCGCVMQSENNPTPKVDIVAPPQVCVGEGTGPKLAECILDLWQRWRKTWHTS